MTSFRTKPLAECAFPRHLLLRRWQTTSYQAGWRFRSDWFQPEVRTVVTSLATRAVIPANTAKSLGAARARNGVGISETMMDFRALFTAANQSLDVDALQSLAEGWAEAAEAAPPISCTDVYTGLATKAHFQRQIHEVSGLATGCQGAYALAVLSMPGHRGSQGHCWTELALLGEAVKGQLRGTGATAMYQDSAIHILFPVSEENVSRMVQCKAALEAVEGGSLTPVRIAFYPLASDAAAVPTAKAPVVSFFESN
ncbi:MULTISPECIES: hypothetical protein [Paenarthrobacter]|uniref:hypothetical protein n=1 Tax=Paenarthrobacter TaxID=1742992 RepID=UPI0023652503|nr:MULTISPECIES: hypothetical protein [Paenarthrobacter]MDD7835978.1 hypothetical protein [Paenarthrobacter sp. AB444]MDP9936064.1 hypothetical protein [Paenarthrobacter nicotinovorans]